MHFTARVDLQSFTLLAAPAPAAIDGLQVCVAGYLSGGSGDPRPLTGTRAAEAVAAAYRRDPDRFPNGLIGQFATIVCDPSSRRAVIAQDALGVRPLFHRLAGNQVEVATSLERLAALAMPPELDDAYFAETIAASLPSFARTPWKGTGRLSRGGVLIFGPDGLRSHRPWSPPGPKRRRADDSGEEFLHLLRQAVKATLPADGNVWSELSGGLDSTTVVAIASELHGGLETLTLTNSMGLASSDQPYVPAALEQYRTPSHVVDCDIMPPYSLLPDRFHGEPGSEFAVERAAAIRTLLDRKRVDVLLTGKGGDIVFGSPDVQPYHLADLLGGGSWLALARELRHYQQRHPDRRGWLHWLFEFGVRATRQHRRGLLLKVSDPRGAMPPWLNLEWLGDHAALDVRQWAPSVATPGQQYFWQEIFGQTLVLWTPERLSYPAETRHPLYHLPLVEHMATVDHRERRRADDDRVLQRRMLKGVLPEAVRTRRTKDGIQKQREIAFTKSGPWHDILLDRPRIVERGWVHASGWREEVERARIGMNVSGRSFDVACLFEAWLRSIEIHAPPPAPVLAPPAASGAEAARA